MIGLLFITKEEVLTSSEKDARACVHEDTLLHLEALLIVAACDSEDVALELLAHDFTIDFLAHSSVVEGTATQQMAC